MTDVLLLLSTAPAQAGIPHRNLLNLLSAVVIGMPVLLVLVLGIASLADRPFSERTTGRLVQWACVAGLIAAIAVLGIMLLDGTREIPIPLGNWVEIEDHENALHYHFSMTLVFDRLSVPFMILSFLLCGTIGAFAARYMHREPGYNRFFVLFALFLLGMLIASLAGTVEMLFVGWELVGLSSALLVAYFQERPAPVRNGVRVWSVYRISDAALLIAALMLHHLKGEGDFTRLVGADGWPNAAAPLLTTSQAFFVGLLFLIGAAGKSALVPFSGWLPRAMEGPTPSSAVFYGALSVHLGAFLLLRIGPILEQSIVLSVLVVILGLVTAAFAAFVGRAQTDIKSALSYASLTQVGIIVAEIGFGLRYIALVHILGHACLRTLQFVRASSLLQDYRLMENAIGSALPRFSGTLSHRLAGTARVWLFRLAFERGYFDAILGAYVVAPVLRVFRWCDALEHRWTDLLSGGQSRESDRVTPSAESLEELV